MLTQSVRSPKFGAGRNVVGFIAQKNAEKKDIADAFLARKRAIRLRDEAIMKIHQLSYSRGNKLIPRKASYRAELKKAMLAAKMYAYLARPERGYPKNPVEKDVDFPQIDTRGISYYEAERNRLVAWIAILESRDDTDTVTLSNLDGHVEYLNNQIEKARIAAVKKMTAERKIAVNSRVVIVEKVR